MRVLRFFDRSARILKFFHASQSGAVALIFGLALVPVMMGMGAALDFANASNIRSKAQKALDSASLAGATAAAATLQAGGTPAAATLAGDNAAKMTFNGNVASWPGVSVASFSPGGSVNSSSASYSPTATLNVPTSFMRMAGMTTVSVTIAATAKSATGAQYIDVYVLVDASQSMGVGASSIDQTNMTNDPNLGCAFACHNNHGGVPGNLDGVAHARSMGYKLRFDVVREALASIVNQAQTVMSQTGAVIRFGVYSFATDFRTEIDIGSNYGSPTTPNSILNAVNTMDIADGGGGTSLKHALDQLKLKIGAAGNGSSPGNPKTYILLMTDGVGNATDNRRSLTGWYDWTYSSTFFPAYSGTPCWSQLPPADGTPTMAPAAAPRAAPCVPNPYVSASWVGNQEMEMIGVDPAWCAPIKSLGATLMTLNTTYLVFHDDHDWRSAYLRRMLVPAIPGTMQACASSPNDAFVANDADQVTAAINKMFKRATAVAAAKLTR